MSEVERSSKTSPQVTTYAVKVVLAKSYRSGSWEDEVLEVMEFTLVYTSGDLLPNFSAVGNYGNNCCIRRGRCGSSLHKLSNNYEPKMTRKIIQIELGSISTRLLK